MRWKIAVAATAVLFVLSSASLIGQGKGNGGSKGPKAQAPSTKPTQSPKATAPTSAKGPKAPKAGAPTTTKSGHGKTTMTAKATAPKGKSDVAGSKAKSTASGMTTAKNTKSSSTTTSSTSMAGSDMNESTNKTNKRTDGTTTTSTDSGMTGSTDPVQLSAVQQKLQKNTNLASKLQSRLPAGTDLMTAADGFRNLGQFVAAVNVSNNLGIPFADLKTKMVDDHLSLGQSIQKLKPTASGTIEAQRADYEAQGMIYQSEQTQASTTTTTTTTTSKKKGKPSGSGGGSDE